MAATAETIGVDLGEGRTGVEPPLSPRRLLTLLASIVLPMFLAVVDSTIVATALPSIAAELGGVERMSWVVVSYLVAGTIAAPVYGQLRDVYGGRRMMLIALAMFVAASLLCAASRSMEMLTVARVLQGLGGGGLMTLAQARIGETIPPRDRARYQGYLASVIVMSSVFGPVAGGLLTQHLGWQSIFLINIPLALIAAAQTWRTTTGVAAPGPARAPAAASGGPRPGFDYPGLAFYVGSIVPLLIALQLCQRPTFGILPMVAALMVLTIVSATALVRQEARAARPLFATSLLGRSVIWRSDALAACHGAALVSLVTLLPLYFHVLEGKSAAETGLFLLPIMIGLGVGSTVTGSAMARIGLTAIFPSVGLMVAFVLVVVLAFVIGHLGRIPLGCLLFAIGLAMGTVMGVVQITVQSAANRNELGAAAASVQVSRSLGAAIGTALVGVALFATLALAEADAGRLLGMLVERGLGAIPLDRRSLVESEIAAAFRVAFLTVAAFTALGSALAWSIPERRLAA